MYGVINNTTRKIVQPYGVIGGVTRLIYTSEIEITYPLYFLTKNNSDGTMVFESTFFFDIQCWSYNL